MRLNRQRKQRERDLEYKPGHANWFKNVEYLGDEERQVIIQEVLLNRKPFPQLAININQNKKIQADEKAYPPVRATG